MYDFVVISTNSAVEALNILRAKEVKVDIIITDVHMPDINGFWLLEKVGLEMDLPCISKSFNVVSTSYSLLYFILILIRT